jgi:serine protease inhibitor
MVTGGRVMKEEPKLFRADQPFHLAIRELRSGTPLFLGRIATPEPYPEPEYIEEGEE